MTFMILTTIVLLSQPLFRTIESKGINFYPKGCYMPDRCKWITDSSEINSHTIDLICNDVSAKFDRDKLKNSSMLCQRRDQPFYHAMTIFFKQQKAIILNNSFDLYNIIYAIWAFFFYDTQLRFTNIIGFSSDLALDLKNSYITIMFIDGEFKIYSKVNGSNRLIQTCQDLRINSTIVNTNFLVKHPTNYSLYFYNTLFQTPICPLIFATSKMKRLSLYYMVKSHYKTNYIRFEDDNQNRSLYQANVIQACELIGFYGLDLTFDIVNRQVFNKASHFIFDGIINSIQVDLFKDFRMLKSIQFNPIYFVDVFRRQGIDWIRQINRDVNVNWSDPESISANIQNKKDISFKQTFAVDFYNDPNLHFFYEEDFCLLKDYPFHQFVVFIFDFKRVDTSCSTIWLMQFYPHLFNISKEYKSNDDLILTINQVFDNKSIYKKCDFESRLKICNRSNYKSTFKAKNVYGFDFMIISKFLLVISTTLISFFGIVTNMLVILTLINKKNEKELKEKQYTYMAITSGINIVILFIQILSLMNECDYPFGIFCSSIRSSIVVQYYKIVFAETISAFLRLLSNFSYIAFSINRISLIGANHGKFVKFVSDLSPKSYLTFSIILSALFSIIKGFRFKINYILPNETYPVLFHHDHRLYSQSRSLTYVSLIYAFNSVYDVVNYLLFTIVHICFDLFLFNKVRITLNEKETKFKSDTKATREKKKKENEEIKRRVLTMVILCAFVNLIGKVPISIVSLNDVRLLVNLNFKFFGANDSWAREHFTAFYSMKSICYLSDGCLLFQDFGNFLYCISISLNLFFFYRFDIKFKNAYQLVFFSKSNKKDFEKDSSKSIS